SATLTSTLPFELNDVVRVHPKGQVSRPEESPTVFLREVGALDYFKTMGVPLRAGRAFEPNDTRAIPKPILVNQAMAQRFWGGNEGVNQILVLENPPDPPAECQIVGVVGDVRQTRLEEVASPEMYMFNWGGRQLVVRTTRPLLAIAGAVHTA